MPKPRRSGPRSWLLDDWHRDDPEHLAAFLDSPELTAALTPTRERNR